MSVGVPVRAPTRTPSWRAVRRARIVAVLAAVLSTISAAGVLLAANAAPRYAFGAHLNPDAVSGR